jgi:hypothetical protein
MHWNGKKWNRTRLPGPIHASLSAVAIAPPRKSGRSAPTLHIGSAELLLHSLISRLACRDRNFTGKGRFDVS